MPICIQNQKEWKSIPQRHRRPKLSSDGLSQISPIALPEVPAAVSTNPAIEKPGYPISNSDLVLPAYLQASVLAGEFEVVEECQLRGPAPQSPPYPRRGAGRQATWSTALKLTLDLPPLESYVVVARQESGAISFHFPIKGAAKAVRGGRAERNSSALLTVTIPVGGEAPTDVGTRRRGTRGIVHRVVHLVVMKVVHSVADAAMEVLGRQLEEKLWEDDQRQEGWVQVELGGSGAVKYRAGLPDRDLSGRSLLLLHGTFSHTEATFRDLFGNRDTALRLTDLYGDRIFGFDHFTISKTPQEIVDELLAALPDALRLTCDVITHSQGGLVLRTLHRHLTCKSRPDPRLTLGRVVLVASPNEGTPLATPARWDQTLSRFANLLEMFPENPFTTAAGWISGSLSWLAQGLTRNLPGIQSMDANGDTIQKLTKVVGAPGEDWSAVVTDTQVPASMGLSARLGDLSVDGFFQEANDLVVSTEGGRQWGGTTVSQIPDTRVGRFAQQGGTLQASADALVMHTTLFGQADTHRFLINSLQWPVVAGTTLFGQVISIESACAICWLDVIPGSRVKVEVPLEKLTGIHLKPGQRFTIHNDPSTPDCRFQPLRSDSSLDARFEEMSRRFREWHASGSLPRDFPDE